MAFTTVKRRCQVRVRKLLGLWIGRVRRGTSMPAGWRDAGDAGDPGEASAIDGPPKFCARDGADSIRDLFCAEPSPRSRAWTSCRCARVQAGGRGARRVEQGSTRSPRSRCSATRPRSSGHLVSPINPRVIVLGAQHVHGLSARHAARRADQPRARPRARSTSTCSTSSRPATNAQRAARPATCTRRGSSPTGAASRSATARSSRTRRSTAAQCHQRGRETPTLLMRELENPWTHFFLPPEPPRRRPGVRAAI